MTFQIKDIPKTHSTFKSRVQRITIQLMFEEIHIKIIIKRKCNIDLEIKYVPKRTQYFGFDSNTCD